MSKTDKKRVVVAGATGTIGKALSKRLIDSGYELVVFSRNPDSARIAGKACGVTVDTNRSRSKQASQVRKLPRGLR